MATAKPSFESIIQSVYESNDLAFIHRLIANNKERWKSDRARSIVFNALLALQDISLIHKICQPLSTDTNSVQQGTT